MRILRTIAPWALVAAMALLGAGTISNQLRINSANTRLQMNALNGQRSLNRQCALLPISKKLYADALTRGVIEPADFARIVSTATAVCPRPR